MFDHVLRGELDHVATNNVTADHLHTEVEAGDSVGALRGLGTSLDGG
ncbi:MULTISPECIES: hypothetical protein [unclassified Micromonospora]